MNVEQAVILAGGRGSRLSKRLKGLPKPLIDIGGKPLLEWQILLLKRYNFKKIIILVNFRSNQIVKFCKENNNWGLDIRCIRDGRFSGTAGAVLNVYDQLDSNFLVMYGDTMLEVDLARLGSAHLQTSDASCTLFVHPNDHPKDSDIVELDISGYVSAFHPYPHSLNEYLPNSVNAALYILRREAIEPWLIREPTEALDFGRNIFPEMLRNGQKLFGYYSPEYIKDCGTPCRLDKINQDFQSGKISRSCLSEKQPTIFIDRDGTLNEDVEYLAHPDKLLLFPGVPNAVRRINKSDYRACIVTNQPVVARGDCSLNELRLIHNKLETLLGEQGAFIDRIYVCPHHPDRGFPGEVDELKIKCLCRKPGSGLIDEAVSTLNSDLSQSWFIGDSTTDIATAHRAGIRSILVETGYAGLDGKFQNLPDFTMPDFVTAVRFILDVFPNALPLARNLLQCVRPGDIVLLGGQSRSGKTSIASLFKCALSAAGFSVHVFSTDRWLRSAEDRSAGVLGRHDIVGLQEVFYQLASRNSCSVSIDLPFYEKHSRRQMRDHSRVQVAPSDIVIIEGVVALGLDHQRKRNVHAFGLRIPEKERHARFVKEYVKRSNNVEFANSLYAQRMIDEYEVVEGFLSEVRIVPPLLDDYSFTGS